MYENPMNAPTELMPDETIIELYWERNETAIKATDEKYGRYLYTISYNILHDRFDSEECVNDTYLATWNRIPPAKPTVLQRFLSKIARNISMNKYRDAHVGKRIPSEMTVSIDELAPYIASASLEEETIVDRISSVLNAYLRGLSKRDRFLFVCRYYYGDSVAYIAQMMEVSDKTAYRDLARIKEGLREALAKEGITV